MLYEFLCKKCGDKFTRFCSKNVQKLKCRCGGTAEKVLSPSAIVFKGLRG